jgi:guanylate kinase
MRRPWNEAATGMMAVNKYDEFLKFVEVISDSYNINQKRYSLDEPSIVVLVGPSGSGKSKIASKFLTQTDRFEKLMSYTTNDPTAVEENSWYNYVSLDEFREMCESGEMFQSTMYAGHGYGSKKSDVEAILSKGKHVMTTMDICGAMSLKTNFPNVTTIYIQRERKDLLKSILRKNSSMDDKINRIIAIEPELKNADICDYVIEFDRYDDAVKQLRNILGV